jgi:hypothetical protein
VALASKFSTLPRLGGVGPVRDLTSEGRRTRHRSILLASLPAATCDPHRQAGLKCAAQWVIGRCRKPTPATIRYTISPRPSRRLAYSDAGRAPASCTRWEATARAVTDPRALVPSSLASRAAEQPANPEWIRLVARCWMRHRAYDTGRLELLPHLEPRWRAEVAHAVLHLGLVGAYRRLGRPWAR